MKSKLLGGYSGDNGILIHLTVGELHSCFSPTLIFQHNYEHESHYTHKHESMFVMQPPMCVSRHAITTQLLLDIGLLLELKLLVSNDFWPFLEWNLNTFKSLAMSMRL